ncbi:MAG TPA: hypothetical protein VI541_03925, partial [Actinomycetota bacterium]|nr:hypothetical protein [Actinomycetota bacterium]
MWATTGSYLLTRTALTDAQSRVDGELQSQMRNAGVGFSDLVIRRIELVRLMSHTQGVPEALKANDFNTLRSRLGPLLLNSRADALLILDAADEEKFALWRNASELEVGAVGLPNEDRRKIGSVARSTVSDKSVLLSRSTKGPLVLTTSVVRFKGAYVGSLAVGNLSSSLVARLGESAVIVDKAGKSQEPAVALYDAQGNFIDSNKPVVMLTKDAVVHPRSSHESVGDRPVLVGELVANGAVVARLAIFHEG